jgi:hypothetical protein
MPYRDPLKDKASKAKSHRKHQALNKERKAALYASDREKFKARSQKWRADNRDQLLKTLAAYKRKKPEYVMLIAARYRAKKTGVAFNLRLRDIYIPLVCPVLGIFLNPGTEKWAPSSPSLDRIKPHLGYVRGNVRVISWRANNLKRDGTAEEFERIAAYIRGEL